MEIDGCCMSDIVQLIYEEYMCAHRPPVRDRSPKHSCISIINHLKLNHAIICLTAARINVTTAFKQRQNNPAMQDLRKI